MKTNITSITLALLVAALVGCGGDEPASNDTTSEGLSAYMLDSAPQGAVSVREARETAQPGDSITVTGQIGAAMKPFGEGHATFVLGDTDIMYCDEMGEDHCPTPWDACCEDPQRVASSRASVQLVENGEPVTGTLKGVGGLAELDRVTVAGKVDPSSTPANLIINATGIYRQAR